VSLYQMITGQGCFNPCKVATWVTERTPLSFSAPLSRDQVLIRVLSIRLSNVFMLHPVRDVRVSLDSLVVYYTLPALSSAVYWDCSLACQPAYGRLSRSLVVVTTSTASNLQFFVLESCDSSI
jgi:hypothetical protein